MDVRVDNPQVQVLEVLDVANRLDGTLDSLVGTSFQKIAGLFAQAFQNA